MVRSLSPGRGNGTEPLPPLPKGEGRGEGKNESQETSKNCPDVLTVFKGSFAGQLNEKSSQVNPGTCSSRCTV